jgi:hypothetical protein
MVFSALFLSVLTPGVYLAYCAFAVISSLTLNGEPTGGIL